MICLWKNSRIFVSYIYKIIVKWINNICYIFSNDFIVLYSTYSFTITIFNSQLIEAYN